MVFFTSQEGRMSFREKLAWISIVSILGIDGLYFWSVIRSGSFTSEVQFGRLFFTVIAVVIVQIVLTIVVAIFAPRDAEAPRDERDRLIDLKAIRSAYALLAFCVACACFVPALHFNANALLLALVMAEAVRTASQIVQYRRGA
jgi:hypothetical protein